MLFVSILVIAAVVGSNVAAPFLPGLGGRGSIADSAFGGVGGAIGSLWGAIVPEAANEAGLRAATGGRLRPVDDIEQQLLLAQLAQLQQQQQQQQQQPQVVIVPQQPQLVRYAAAQPYAEPLIIRQPQYIY